MGTPSVSPRHETFDVSLPAPQEQLGVIQTRAIFTEQLQSDQFRFRELIYIVTKNGWAVGMASSGQVRENPGKWRAWPS